MTILAVDHGTTYIGLALSDPENIVARPLVVYTHTSGEQDAVRVAEAADNAGASLILLGAPTNALGEHLHKSTRTSRFASKLRKHTTLRIHLWDESDSTVRAHQILTTHHKRRKPPNISLHSIAAAVILQDFLDTHAN